MLEDWPALALDAFERESFAAVFAFQSTQQDCSSVETARGVAGTAFQLRSAFRLRKDDPAEETMERSCRQVCAVFAAH